MPGIRTLLGIVVVLCITISLPIAFATQPTNSVAYHYKILSSAHRATGEQKALIILVEFQDVHHSKSLQEIQSVAVSELNAYYNEVSYGHITITGTVFGWYTIDQKIGHYGRNSKNPGDDDNVELLPSDAIEKLPASVDVSGFKDLVIVHAGQDQATDQSRVRSDEIWSRCQCSVFPNYENGTPVRFRGKTFSNYLILSEYDGLGTFAHEWGHVLGLPDLYDTTNEESYVGFWSLMDDGSHCCYNDAASTPSYVGAWGAAILGWLTPTVGDPNAPISTLSLFPLESPQATAMLIPISQSRYYFVEERTKSGSDSNLPAEGILVYMADESLDTGQGILKLIDPKTGIPFPSQAHSENLNAATFSTSDHMYDPSHSIFLNFIDETEGAMVLYTTTPLTGSLVSTQMHASTTRVTAAYNDELTTTVVLIDQTGTPVTSQIVQIDARNAFGEWEQVGSSTTDQAGGAIIGLALKYDAGAYNFRVYYPGGEAAGKWYLPSSVLVYVTIVPAKMIVTLPQTPMTVTSTPAVVVVTDSHGNPLTGASVTPYMGGIQMRTVTTDSTGRANFMIPASQIGTQQIMVKVSLANYESATATSSTFIFPIWLILTIVGIAIATSALMILILRKRSHRSQAH